jgi:hypothetical protein
MFMKRALLISLEAVVVIAFLGCAPTIVSTDAGVYQTGKLYARSGASLDAVYTATLQAMDKLELRIIDKAKDVFAAKVVAKSADGKEIVVRIKPTADKKTEYNIRVGSLGNEERSRKIFMEIENSLGTK